MSDRAALRLLVDETAEGQRVDKWLASKLPGVSRAKIQAWILQGRVQIDGKACRARAAILPGNIVDVQPAEPSPSGAEPDDSVSIDVLYEDEHLLVINKPAGLVVHPARGHATGTLVNGLLARGGFSRESADARDAIGHLRPGIVHRIDKDTSGLLVVTKTDIAREGLKQDLALHQVERVYQAITCGVPSVSEIRTLYGRHPKSRLRFTSLLEAGKAAVTQVRLLEVLAAGHAALVECRLETGRTHQIRVHLMERAETPLLADKLYRNAKSFDPSLKGASESIGRQALHAGVLGFEHPVTKGRHRFEVPPPREFLAAIEVLRVNEAQRQEHLT